MVIQFGYITLFASAFPGAAVLALVCNTLELFSDLFKVSFLTRRPQRLRTTNGIGRWRHMLFAIMLASIFTNAILFAFASDQMAMLFPSLFVEGEHHPHSTDMVVREGMGRYVVLTLFGVEHALLLLLFLSRLVIPDAPRWVLLTIAQRDHEKKALLRANRASSVVVQPDSVTPLT